MMIHASTSLTKDTAGNGLNKFEKRLGCLLGIGLSTDQGGYK